MDLINSFSEDCKARGLTKHTTQTYLSNIKDFIKLYPEPSAVTLDDLRNYLGNLRNRELQGSTLKGYFAALSALYDFLIFEGKLKSNPVLGFRKRYLKIKDQYNGDNTRQIISIEDMQRLVNIASKIQNKAIIITLSKTGMRVGELLSLRIQDIDMKNKIIRIPPKAKRSNRLVFMDPELHTILQRYLYWRMLRAKVDWLWVTKRGKGRIHKDTPRNIISYYGLALGLHVPNGPLVKRLTPHCMRHWFTTHLFRAGMDPQYIMWLRGDSMGSQSWQIYNHIDPEAVRKEYLRCIPQILSGSRILGPAAGRTETK